MTGTTGSVFEEIFSAKGGRVGIRALGADEGTGKYRVRVEPTNGPLPRLSREAGWKQPGDGQHRHSIVCDGAAELAKAVALAVAEVLRAGLQ